MFFYDFHSNFPCCKQKYLNSFRSRNNIKYLQFEGRKSTQKMNILYIFTFEFDTQTCKDYKYLGTIVFFRCYQDENECIQSLSS